MSATQYNLIGMQNTNNQLTGNQETRASSKEDSIVFRRFHFFTLLFFVRVGPLPVVVR